MRGEFMSNIMKCPICMKDMKKDKNLFICPDCGYRIMASKAAPDSGQLDVPEKKPAIHAGINRKPAAQKRNTEIHRTGGITRSIAAACAVVSIVLIMIFAFKGIRGVSDTGLPNGSGSKTPEPVSETHGQNEEQAAENVDTSGYRPESDAVIDICETIFDKSMDNISREELESVTGLTLRELDDDYISVEYTLSDNTSDSITIEARHIDTGDFRCFRKIKSLRLDGFSITSDTNFFKLRELDTLEITGSIDELVDVMDVSQLRSLTIRSRITTGDLSALAQFTNLETLCLETYNGSDISGLMTAPALTSLYIGHGDNIKDFNELFFTSNLKELSIEAKNLKSIDFLMGYGQLEYLELKNTSVSKLDALDYCKDTLTTLRLHQNYSVGLDEYEIVKECKGLRELELYPDYNFDVVMEAPDLSMLTELTSLSLGNYDDLGNVKKLPQLTQLTLSGVYCGDSEALSGLNELEQLTLDDMSIPPEFLAPVSAMDKLTYIDMHDTFLWGDISCVFAAPALESLNLKDASIGINELTLGVSETITALDIEGTRFYLVNDDGSYNYGSSPVPLNENLYFFGAFPALEYLNASGQELEDMDLIK